MKNFSYLSIFFLKFIFLTAGILFLTTGCFLFIKADKTKNREKTDGVIISSSLAEVQSEEGKFNYIPDISYSYKINNENYICKKISLNQGYIYNYHSASRKVRQYKKGKNVIVFYDPEKPQNAVLETDVDIYKIILNLTAGLIFLSIGIILFMGGLKNSVFRTTIGHK